MKTRHAFLILGGIVLSWALITNAKGTANDNPPANLDFEQGEVGKLPPSWFLPKPSQDAGFRAEISETNPKQGKHCALLASGDKAGFGNLITSVDASAYRGKRVRFKAAVRSEVARGAPLMFWIRVDRANDETGFFDNMADRPITSKEWAYYETAGDVADDASRISIGLMFNGTGRAWIDDVSLEIIGKIGEGNQPPAPLEKRGLENLVAFARLLGYVRYFHPSDEAAKTNWDQFAIDYVSLVEPAIDSAELAQTLSKIFKPIAPSVQVYLTGQTPPAVAPIAEEKKSQPSLYWRHDGVGTGSAQSVYASKRVPLGSAGLLSLTAKLPKEVPVPDANQPFSADLGAGVSCFVPLVVHADDRGTLPKPTAEKPPTTKPKGFSPNGNDRSTRLADVILAWNVFQHFYPYFDVVGTDWSAELPKALTRAAIDKNESEFHQTLRRLVAALKDGHGGVMYGNSRGRGSSFPPLRWDWIEDRLVITHVDKDKANGLEPGDVTISVNGVPAVEALAKVEELISGATPQWRRFHGLSDLGSGPRDSELRLVIERGRGQQQTITVKRTPEAAGFFIGQGVKPEKIAEIKPGIWYADIDRISEKDFESAIPNLEKAAGIVYDLRGYPSQISPATIGHLTDKPVTCAQWHVPVVVYPDRKNMGFSFSNWTVPPRKPRFTAKVAFITDGRAISYAETYLGIIEHYKLADIVGGPTAGTNGNVNPFSLPGGYRLAWTGMKVLKHDGSQHHGIGIQPTVPAKRTIHGVKDGKDELLDKAIQVVGG